MNTVTFISARNGSTTCSVDGIYLHSKFDPEKEADRFISMQTPDYTPTTVVITGSCMNYTIPCLQTKWPGVRIISVQYTTAFSPYDSGISKTLYCSETTTSEQIAESLFSCLGEEEACTTLFISWEPADKLWTESSKTAWQGIKAYLKKARDVTGTRNWFNRRWLKNTVRFFSLVQHTIRIPSFSAPILVCASGPSLEYAIPVLKKYRDRYFLLALSSATAPLLHHNLIPDAILSTDGGWWATCHLRPVITDSRLKDVPVWITAESAVPSEILHSHPVQYITYNDPFETYLLSAIGGSDSTNLALPGIRNGTVSGTALGLATRLTDNAVFFCGLDLAENKGHQHTQPNYLEVLDSAGETRIKTKEHRNTPRTFTNGSLAIYRSWFSTRTSQQCQRCYRILRPTEHNRNSQLGVIPDKDIGYLSDCLASQKTADIPAANKTSYKKKAVSHALEQLQIRLEEAHRSGSPNQLVTSFLKSAALPEFLMAGRDKKREQLDLVYRKAEELLTELIDLAENLEAEDP